MKTRLFVIGMFILSGNLQAQSDLVITGSKKITKDMTPQQVVDALNKKFPDAKAVTYYQTPAANASNGWDVNVEDNLGGQEVDYYEVSFKNSDLKYYALYQQDGTLVKSRIEHKTTDLPDPIKASIKTLSAQYPGYTVVSKTYYKNQNYAKSKEYYEVVAKKGNTKKTLFYAPDGTIVKVK